MGWIEFAAAGALFAATHFLPSHRPVRDGLIRTLGRRRYFALYGAVSTVLLVWLVIAAGRAPHVPVFDAAPWTRWTPMLAMPPAFALFALGLAFPYPHTLAGRRSARFDPAAPGLARLTRHPALLALALWGVAHAIANPDLAHLILFLGFAAVSVGAMQLFDRRAAAAEPDRWPAIEKATAWLSLRPLADPAWLRAHGGVLALRAGLGLLLYLAAFHAHAPVIGVSPAP
jgi:uncharacterized membrane protein